MIESDDLGSQAWPLFFSLMYTTWVKHAKWQPIVNAYLLGRSESPVQKISNRSLGAKVTTKSHAYCCCSANIEPNPLHQSTSFSGRLKLRGDEQKNMTAASRALTFSVQCDAISNADQITSSIRVTASYSTKQRLKKLFQISAPLPYY